MGGSSWFFFLQRFVLLGLADSSWTLPLPYIGLFPPPFEFPRTPLCTSFFFGRVRENSLFFPCGVVHVLVGLQFPSLEFASPPFSFHHAEALVWNFFLDAAACPADFAAPGARTPFTPPGAPPVVAPAIFFRCDVEPRQSGRVTYCLVFFCVRFPIGCPRPSFFSRWGSESPSLTHALKNDARVHFPSVPLVVLTFFLDWRFCWRRGIQANFGFFTRCFLLPTVLVVVF